MKKLVISAIALFGFAGSALAEAPPRHPIPPEAIAACKGASAGTACSVEFHDRKIEGTCVEHPDYGMVCRPNQPPPPPQEAFDACKASKEGDACTVSFGGHDISGVCATFPGGGLACRPSGPPPGR